MRPFPRRLLRAAGIAVLTVLALLTVSTVANLLLERSEKESIVPYGNRVAIGSGSVNVYRNGETGPPLVLLGGLGTAAPAVDFAPLIRELDGFDVTVVEGFGYGYADMSADERTNEHISTELHETLGRIGVAPPYILAGHSIAGFYMLDYANRYPAEVAAVIGIDATIPKANDGGGEDADQTAAPEQGINWNRILSVTGLVRLAAAAGLEDPEPGAYTEDEVARIRAMTSWNYGNSAVADETARIAGNAAALGHLSYPDDLPVLAFVAGGGGSAEQTDATENLLRNVRVHKVVRLDGGHYLHQTQSEVMAEEIRAFLGSAGQ